MKKRRDQYEIQRIIQFGQRLIGTLDDGLIGDKTKQLIERRTAKIPVINRAWSDERKLIAFVQFHALSKGIEAGSIDGLIGSQTRFAFEQLVYLEKFSRLPETWRDEDKEVVPVPSSQSILNPHQFPSYSTIENYYGKAGTNQITVRIPFPFRLAWDKGVIVKRITCHQLIADSLRNILEKLLEHYTISGLQKLGIDLYGGCFNQRKMRGGKKASTHSWGAAIDLNPEANQLRWNSQRAVFAKQAYAYLLKVFADEGWISLGVEKDYDWMHFQAVRL